MTRPNSGLGRGSSQLEAPSERLRAWRRQFRCFNTTGAYCFRTLELQQFQRAHGIVHGATAMSSCGGALPAKLSSEDYFNSSPGTYSDAISMGDEVRA